MRAGVLIFCVMGLMAGLAGCDSAPADPRAKPGFLIGKITDAAGKPLKKVTITVSGFLHGTNEPVSPSVTIEGPATEYALALPPGMYGTPTAQISVEYNDLSYTLPLAPVDNLREWLESKDSRQGLVRDFVWKIHGPRPGTTAGSLSPGDYWGAAINFDKSGPFGDSANFEITLTPDGPLMDGSTGAPVTFLRTLPPTRHEDHLLLDIPLGRYTATVKYLYGAKPKLLKMVCYTMDAADPSVVPETTTTKGTVDFEMQKNRDGTWELKMPNLVVTP